MTRARVLAVGVGLALLQAAPPAGAQECPATCRTTHFYFSEVSYEQAMTTFVDGWPGSVWPSHAEDAGGFLFSLTLSFDQAEQVAQALESGCPVEVRYWTRGQILASRDAVAGYSALLETRRSSALGDTLLESVDETLSGGPPVRGRYEKSHVVPITEPLAEGESLTLQASASAHATAIGTSTGDYGSALWTMFHAGGFGGPLLALCVP